MRKVVRGLTVLAIASGVVACGADVGDTAAQLIGDAGELLEDAGQAIADAGSTLADAAQAMADASTADAQVLPADSGAQQKPAPRVLEQACDVTRTATYPNQAQSGTQHFASFEAKLEDIRSAWLCDDAGQDVLACPSGATCTGATIPRARCVPASAIEAADGRLWVQCQAWRKAKLVLD